MAQKPVVAGLRPEKPAMADRRERILQAAMNRFAEFGFSATTVRQIADDVDILSGSLYHHFATKEEMLDEIIRETVERQRDLLIKIASGPQDAELRLVALILANLREFVSHQAIHAILFFERKFIRRSPQFAYVHSARQQTHDAWLKVIDDGVHEGLFRSEIDINFSISTMVRMLNTGADWYHHEDGNSIDTLVNYSLCELENYYIDFILRSMRHADRINEPVPRAAAEMLID